MSKRRGFKHTTRSCHTSDSLAAWDRWSRVVTVGIWLLLLGLALQVVAAFLIWRVGLRTIGRTPAAVAAAIYWIWPPFLINYLTHAFGFHGSGVAYCALLLLLALRVVERPDRIRVGLLGLVVGLAFWETPQIVAIIPPVLAWTIWRQPRCLRRLWLAAPLAVIG